LEILDTAEGHAALAKASATAFEVRASSVVIVKVMFSRRLQRPQLRRAKNVLSAEVILDIYAISLKEQRSVASTLTAIALVREDQLQGTAMSRLRSGLEDSLKVAGFAGTLSTIQARPVAISDETTTPEFMAPLTTTAVLEEEESSRAHLRFSSSLAVCLSWFSLHHWH